MTFIELLNSHFPTEYSGEWEKTVRKNLTFGTIERINFVIKLIQIKVYEEAEEDHVS